MTQPFNPNLPANPLHAKLPAHPPAKDDLGYDGGSMFDWVEGQPRPKRRQGMGKEQVQNIHNAAAALPYQGEWNPLTQRFEMPPDLDGLTLAEVAIVRQWQKAADGDTKAYTTLMDRMLGKPKQAVETVSMKMSYSEFLDMMAAQDEQENVHGNAPTRPVSDTEDEGSIIDTIFSLEALAEEEEAEEETFEPTRPIETVEDILGDL